MLKKSYSKTKPVCKVTFNLPLEAAKGGKDVRILGEFNDWSWENGYKMKAGKATFTTQVELEAGKEYQFRYLIDNHVWENDWAADNYVSSPFTGVTNSVVALQPVAETVAKIAVKKAPAKKSTGKAAPVAKAKPAASKPVAKKAPAKTVKANDLTKIEGIGPKIAGLLKADGIVTFTDLAKAKKANLKAILEVAGKRYQMHDPTTWAQQAKLAATGKWEVLAKLQGELKGGKA